MINLALLLDTHTPQHDGMVHDGNGGILDTKLTLLSQASIALNHLGGFSPTMLKAVRIQRASNHIQWQLYEDSYQASLAASAYPWNVSRTHNSCRSEMAQGAEHVVGR